MDPKRAAEIVTSKRDDHRFTRHDIQELIPKNEPNVMTADETLRSTFIRMLETRGQDDRIVDAAANAVLEDMRKKNV